MPWKPKKKVWMIRRTNIYDILYVRDLSFEIFALLHLENQLKLTCVCKKTKNLIETYWKNTKFMKINILSHHTHKQLLIKCDKITYLTINRIVNIDVLNFSNIKILNLTGTIIEDKWLPSIEYIPFIQMSVEILILDKLKEQSMIQNKVREFSSTNLLRSLFECISFNTLTTLSLAYCYKFPLAIIIGTLIVNGNQYKFFNVYGCHQFSVIFLSAVIDNVPNVIDLNLGRIPNVGIEILEKVINLKKLEKLGLHHCQKVNDYALEKLVEHSTLKILDIRECPKVTENLKNQFRRSNITIID